MTKIEKEKKYARLWAKTQLISGDGVSGFETPVGRIVAWRNTMPIEFQLYRRKAKVRGVQGVYFDVFTMLIDISHFEMGDFVDIAFKSPVKWIERGIDLLLYRFRSSETPGGTMFAFSGYLEDDALCYDEQFVYEGGSAYILRYIDEECLRYEIVEDPRKFEGHQGQLTIPAWCAWLPKDERYHARMTLAREIARNCSSLWDCEMY